MPKNHKKFGTINSGPGEGVRHNQLIRGPLTTWTRLWRQETSKILRLR